jgi:hypothetical protein
MERKDTKLINKHILTKKWIKVHYKKQSINKNGAHSHSSRMVIPNSLRRTRFAVLQDEFVTNSVSDEDQKFIQNSLERLFPRPSKFEIGKVRNEKQKKIVLP